MKHTISLVTVCMNRLHHLQETLRRNIEDNNDYEQLEFVVLDYNSGDGLAEWIQNRMWLYIETGRLRYFHTREPACYHPAHARNMAFLLSKGQLICNVDADNYTGAGFATYLNDRFCEQQQSILITFGGKKNIAPQDTYGRVCVTRADFMAVNGYNECIDRYCGEDIDLAKRVTALGRRTVVMEEERFLHSITHHDSERISQMAFLRTIAACYLTTDIAGFSRVLFLFQNSRFVLVTLLAQGQRLTGEWQNTSDEGSYAWSGNALQLSFDNGFIWRLWKQLTGNMLSFACTREAPGFYEVTTNNRIATWAIQYMLRDIKAMQRSTHPVNPNGFGRGTVFHNLDFSNPIVVGSPFFIKTNL